MRERYANMFKRLEAKNEGAFIPFVTLGDPDPETSLTIIRTLVENGADALELGFPFSDPIADGPTIQKASLRALQAGMTVEACFRLITDVRASYPELPVGLLLYANLVVHQGVEAFYARAEQAGVDAILLADVPLLEADLVEAAAQSCRIAPVYIAAPQAGQDILREIARRGSGYTYLLSRGGVTGTETSAGVPTGDIIRQLEAYGAPPAVLGFGISRPEHVRDALRHGAKGVFCGSAIVRIIEENVNRTSRLTEKLAAYVRAMKAATRPLDG
ncbi:MAG: tryptophan synthase subunit alpha [Calditrichaeota bacterium]|nr:MAG: tryptophan synthase subunit alpha [Calditrichota bacterium]